jgi:hypothetical protein
MRAVRNPGWGDVAALALAIFLFVSPWLCGYAGHPAAGRDAWICGAVIAVASVSALIIGAGWEEWASLAAGLWLVLSPWLFGFEHTAPTAMRIEVMVGVGVVVIALANLWAERERPHAAA